MQFFIYLFSVVILKYFIFSFRIVFISSFFLQIVNEKLLVVTLLHVVESRVLLQRPTYVVAFQSATLYGCSVLLLLLCFHHSTRTDMSVNHNPRLLWNWCRLPSYVTLVCCNVGVESHRVTQVEWNLDWRGFWSLTVLKSKQLENLYSQPNSLVQAIFDMFEIVWHDPGHITL